MAPGWPSEHDSISVMLLHPTQARACHNDHMSAHLGIEIQRQAIRPFLGFGSRPWGSGQAYEGHGLLQV
jgi:hypothetical protein